MDGGCPLPHLGGLALLALATREAGGTAHFESAGAYLGKELAQSNGDDVS